MGKQTRQKRSCMIRAGGGPGWSLWVPAAIWESMIDQERAAMVARQAALMTNREDLDNLTELDPFRGLGGTIKTRHAAETASKC